MPAAESPANRSPVDGARHHRLSEAYAGCFALILQLRGVRDFGDEPVLRRRIEQLLDRAEKDALAARHTRDDIEAASFALVAFIDETILASDWVQKDRWLSRPLQLQRYQRYDAGEYFYERLATLRKAPAERAQALEVYYLCMTLGFKGQYMLHEQEKLRILIEETQRDLAGLPAMEAERLAPHGRPRDQRASAARGKVPTWAIFIGAVAIGLLIYLGMLVYVSGAARSTARSIDGLTSIDDSRLTTQPG